MQQISLSKQHGQTNVFLFVRSLPHFFLFFHIYIFFLHPHLYFFPHFICNSFFTPYGNSARLWCVCIARTKLIIQAHRTPGGQHILVLWQTGSLAVRGEETQLSNKETAAVLALARIHSSHMYVHHMQIHMYICTYMYMYINTSVLHSR